MSKTIVQAGGDLYHQACLGAAELKNATTVSAEEVDEGMECFDCELLLVGDDAPEDVEVD